MNTLDLLAKLDAGLRAQLARENRDRDRPVLRVVTDEDDE